MDAKTFFEEAHRMCKMHDDCRGCPEYDNVHNCLFEDYPSGWGPEEMARALKAVENWSKEHPKKTRLMDFLEKHPTAPLNAIGKPKLTPWYLGYCGDTPCYACKKAKGKPFAWCWDQEVEDDEID